MNLQFFLTDDYHVEKTKKKLVQTQTDELEGDGRVEVAARRTRDKFGREILEYRPEQLYIPKKTGIDAFTQVENDELFNFDREVDPIVKVIATKTLEQAVLELEEDVELEKMKKFKQDVVQRYVSKNDADWKEIVDVETEKVLKLNGEMEAQTSAQVRQELLSLKIVAHHTAHNYLSGLSARVLGSLELRARYRPTEEDSFATGFMSYITEEVLEFLSEEAAVEGHARELFPEVEPGLIHERQEPDKRAEGVRGEVQTLVDYVVGSRRRVFFHFENEQTHRPLVVSSFFSLVADGTFSGYVDSMIPRFEDMFSRFERGNMSEIEYHEVFRSEMPDPGKLLEFANLDNLKNLSFGFANNASMRLIKTDRVFSARAVHISPEFKVKERAGFELRSTKNQAVRWEHAQKVEGWDRQDEETVRLGPLAGGFTLVYLFCDDFEPHLGSLDKIKASRYRLYEGDTGTSFFESSLEKTHDQLFAVNPDELRSKVVEPTDGEEVEEEEKLRCMVGCFLIYENKQGRFLDRLNSHVYERATETQMIERVVAGIKIGNVPGDLPGLLAFWGSRLEDKKDQEDRKGVVSKNSVVNDDDDDSSPPVPVKFDDAKQEDQVEPEVKSSSVSNQVSHFIGPILVDLEEDDYEKVVQKIEEHLKEKNPAMLDEFPDGFEILYKGITLPSVRKIYKVKDYRILTLNALQKQGDNTLGVQDDQAGDGNDGQ